MHELPRRWLTWGGGGGQGLSLEGGDVGRKRCHGLSLDGVLAQRGHGLSLGGVWCCCPNCPSLPLTAPGCP